MAESTLLLNRFAHQIQGTSAGPKLVFLHGLMGFGANWRRIVPYFENHYEVLTYDQRGHGRSFKPDRGYAPTDFADDLREILEALNWSEIFLVGHSMGGRAAMNFAFRFPDRVRALVIEDIGPNRDLAAIARIEGLLNRVPTPFQTALAAKEFFLNQFGDPVLGAYLNTNLEPKSDGRWDWRFSKSAMLEAVREGRSLDRWEEVEGLRVPTLVIRGEKSVELPREVFARMQSCNPKISGVEVPGAGHWVHFDKAKEFADLLAQFLRTFDF